MVKAEHKFSSMVTRTRLCYLATGIFLFAFIKSLFTIFDKFTGIDFRVCLILLPFESPLTNCFDVSISYDRAPLAIL